MSSRITIAYLLMALKKVTELLLLLSIETTSNVFDYLMQQAFSEPNYMPFCLRSCSKVSEGLHCPSKKWQKQYSLLDSKSCGNPR